MKPVQQNKAQLYSPLTIHHSSVYNWCTKNAVTLKNEVNLERW